MGCPSQVTFRANKKGLGLTDIRTLQLIDAPASLTCHTGQTTEIRMCILIPFAELNRDLTKVLYDIGFKLLK